MKPRPLRVLALFDTREDLPRGHDFSRQFRDESWRSERQVVHALKALGHEVSMLALRDNLEILIDEVRDFAPDAAFNLMEEFRGDSNLVPTVLGMLETLRVPYTGAGPAALLLCKDKALSKDLLSMRKIPTPAHQTARQGRPFARSPELEFPLIVKPRFEDASYGISSSSVVRGEAELARRIRMIHERRRQDAVVEAFVGGRELYCGLLGTRNLRALPLRELSFGDLTGAGPAVAGFKLKWDAKYRRRHGVRCQAALGLPEAAIRSIQSVCREACDALRVEGFARVDLRLDAGGAPFVLEVNPNPDLSRGGDFALAARRGGLSFEALVQEILEAGLGRSWARPTRIPQAY